MFPKVDMISFFMLMYVLSSHKELLCFHKPLPFFPSDLLKRENIIGELSVEKAAKTMRFFTDSCKRLDVKN